MICTVLLIQTDRVQENLKEVASFGKIACTSIDSPPPYLVQLYFTIVTKCLQKHSVRPQSDEVCCMSFFFHFRTNYFSPILFIGYAMVEFYKLLRTFSWSISAFIVQLHIQLYHNLL